MEDEGDEGWRAGVFMSDRLILRWVVGLLYTGGTNWDIYSTSKEKEVNVIWKERGKEREGRDGGKEVS